MAGPAVFRKSGTIESIMAEWTRWIPPFPELARGKENDLCSGTEKAAKLMCWRLQKV